MQIRTHNITGSRNNKGASDATTHLNDTPAWRIKAGVSRVTQEHNTSTHEHTTGSPKAEDSQPIHTQWQVSPYTPDEQVWTHTQTHTYTAIHIRTGTVKKHTG